MKGKRFAAGLMSAVMLMSAPGAIQTALAADQALSTGSAAVALASSSTTSSYQVKVTAYSLNVRKSADKSSTVTAVLSKGDVVTIVDESKDSRGVTWGKLKSGSGWINLSYTTKTSSSYQVKVTAYNLNVRKSADKNSTVTAVLSKGDVVTITAESNDSRGVTWGKLKSGAGWINLSYTTKSTTDSDNAVTSYKVKVTATSLNVRSSAGTSGAIKGVLKKGDIVTIVAEKKDSKGNTWGQVENSKGWISLKYTTKTSDSPDFSKYNVKVTAYSLNIRKSADKDSAVQGVLSQGDVVTIVAEKKDSRGVTWGQLSSGKGWISLKYATKTSDSSSSFTSYQVKVTADTLNIRKKADKDSAVVGYLKKGNVFTIVDEAKDSRGATWGKLKNGDGWINLKYTKKV